MAKNSYTKERTALLFSDPYNDFLSEGGKMWPLVVGTYGGSAGSGGKMVKCD